jgi:hypothetical protein
VLGISLQMGVLETSCYHITEVETELLIVNLQAEYEDGLKRAHGEHEDPSNAVPELPPTTTEVHDDEVFIQMLRTMLVITICRTCYSFSKFTLMNVIHFFQMVLGPH